MLKFYHHLNVVNPKEVLYSLIIKYVPAKIIIYKKLNTSVVNNCQM